MRIRLIAFLVSFACQNSLAFAEEFGFPNGTMVPIRNRAIELCPTEYRALKSYYAENHEAVFDGYSGGLWLKPYPSLDKWYVHAFVGIGLTFIKIPDEVLQTAAWTTITPDVVRFPLVVGETARKIHLAGPEKDLSFLRERLELHLTGLRLALPLSECLYPGDDVLEKVEAERADIAEAIRYARGEIDCNDWYRLSHELLEGADVVDERKLYAEFQKILFDTVGVCKEERAQAAE